MSYSYFNLIYSYYNSNETCASCEIPSDIILYKSFEIKPKKSFFSSKLKGEDVAYRCIEILDMNAISIGYMGRYINFFEDGSNKDIELSGWKQCNIIPKSYHTRSINMFELPVKIWNGKQYLYGIYSFPFSKHTCPSKLQGIDKLISEAVTVLFSYAEFSISISDNKRIIADMLKDKFKISFKNISESEFKLYL